MKGPTTFPVSAAFMASRVSALGDVVTRRGDKFDDTGESIESMDV